MKNSIFEIPIIPQTLNIKDWRTKSVKSFNLDIIRKLVEYSLKNSCEGNVYSHRFRDIAVRRQVGIMTGTARHKERKGYMESAT